MPDENSLSLFHLQAHFWQLDARQRFSSIETRLYFYLLNRFNAEFWPAELLRWSKQVEADLGITDKTLATARASLATRRLLTYREGTKTKAAAWTLAAGPVNMSRNNSDPSHITRNNSDKSAPSLSNMSRNNSDESALITPDMSRNNSGLYIDKTKTKEDKENNAADAATSPVILIAEFSSTGKSPAAEPSFSPVPDPVPAVPTPAKPARSPKKPIAKTDEVAALPLPHPGEVFAQRWATFRAGPKQAKKPLSAFELMLTKLSNYREAFAVEMLEAAIQGDWSGVENPGTAGKYAEWQAQHPALRSTTSIMGPDFSVDALFGLKRTFIEIPSHLDPEAVAAKTAHTEADMQRRADARKQRQANPAAQEPPESETPDELEDDADTP